MPTPNTYDIDYFKDIISRSGNIFHQTSISNLKNILTDKAIYSPGTLWGLNSALANSIYSSNANRAKNLKHRADTGFMDYVFCSFKNGVLLSNRRYGTISIEIQKEVLLNRECFIYPFNFAFSWTTANKTNKYSDLSVWDLVVSGRRTVNNEEILVRRKINLSKYHVKFHCFSSVQSKVLAILKEFDYSEGDLEGHEDPSSMAGGYIMNTEATALINGEQFKAILSEDGKFASIFNVISEDDSDLLGRFEVSEAGDLVENFPMSDESKIVGKLNFVTGQSSNTATA